MASNKKKKQREAKKYEQERLAKAKDETLETGTPAPQLQSKKKKKKEERVPQQEPLKDSRGRNIPSEEARYRKAQKKAAKRTTVPQKDKEPVKVKTKYVLEPKAKMAVGGIAALAVGIIVAIVVLIASSSPTPTDTASDSTATVSVLGISDNSKQLIKGTAKYDGFFIDEEGTPYASVYDTDIVESDVPTLNKYSQYPHNGIFPYNEERSSAKPDKDAAAAREAAAESKAAAQNTSQSANILSR